MIIKHADVGAVLDSSEYHGDSAHTVDGSTDYSLVPSGAISIFVASNTASAEEKALAGTAYTCVGDATDATKINAAITAAGAGGIVELSDGPYVIAATINQSYNNSTLLCKGTGAILTAVAGLGANPMIVVSGQHTLSKNIQCKGEGIATYCWKVQYSNYATHVWQYSRIEDCYGEGALTADFYYNDTWMNWLTHPQVGHEAESVVSQTGVLVSSTSWCLYMDEPSITMCAVAHVHAYGSFVFITNPYIGDGDGEGVIFEGKKQNIMGGFVEDTGKNNVLIRNVTGGIEGAGDIKLIGVSFNQASRADTNLYDTIAIEAADGSNTIAKISIIGCNIEDSFSKAKYGISIGNYVNKVSIIGNPTIEGVTAPVFCNNYQLAEVVASGNAKWDIPIGAIDRGEIKREWGSLTAGNANAIGFAWHNLEATGIMVKRLVINIGTPGGTAGSHLDVGVADDAAGTNRGTEFFNDLDLNTTANRDSWVAGDGGTQTSYVYIEDVTVATNGWIVGQILDANAAALGGGYYIEYTVGLPDALLSELHGITDFLDNTANGTDGLVTKAPTSNVFYDHRIEGTHQALVASSSASVAGQLSVTGSLVASSSASVAGGMNLGGYLDIQEHALPATPSTNTLRLYAADEHGFSVLSFVDDKGMLRKFVRDSVFIAKNMSTGTIPALRTVHAAGSTSGVPMIAKAQADASTSMPCIGVTLESMTTGTFGRVMQVGLVEDVWTAGYSEGDVLYVSSTEAGLVTTVPPVYPNLRQEIGTVLVSDATGGAVQVVSRSVTLDPSDILYEDNLVSNSTTKMVVEHNIKTYADTKLSSTGGTVTGLTAFSSQITIAAMTSSNPSVLGQLYWSSGYCMFSTGA